MFLSGCVGIGEHVLHGGHFYGGHVAMAMDSMKNCVANLADLADRQIATMVDVKMNHGLPANLSASTAERRFINHGFKAIQIGCSAWTAEALKLTMPASVFSRSTECHNQDKVSMGTIAARDCLRILQLTEQVLAATLLASVQGVRPPRLQHPEALLPDRQAGAIPGLAEVRRGSQPEPVRLLDDRTCLCRHAPALDLLAHEVSEEERLPVLGAEPRVGAPPDKS